jgi:hypothetical protein
MPRMKWMLAAIAAALLAGAVGQAQRGYTGAKAADPVLKSCLRRSSQGLLADAAALPDPTSPSAITVDYPTEGSLFPPDIIAPTFQWRDADNSVTSWQIEIAFLGRGSQIKLWSHGEKLEIGEIDSKLVGFVPPKLTPEQADAHTWKPDPETWSKIKT